MKRLFAGAVILIAVMSCGQGGNNGSNTSDSAHNMTSDTTNAYPSSNTGVDTSNKAGAESGGMNGATNGGGSGTDTSTSRMNGSSRDSVGR